MQQQNLTNATRDNLVDEQQARRVKNHRAKMHQRGRPSPGVPLILGEAPSKGGDAYWQYPLSGPPSRVLCKMAEIQPSVDGTTYGRWYWELLDRFAVWNLFPRYGAAYPWSAGKARAAAEALLHDLPPVTVLLGQRVAAAFGLEGTGYLYRCSHITRDPEKHGIVIPHPSGLNRVYNDPQQRQEAGFCLRQALALAELHK